LRGFGPFECADRAAEGATTASNSCSRLGKWAETVTRETPASAATAAGGLRSAEEPLDRVENRLDAARSAIARRWSIVLAVVGTGTCR
jgi:hypothetical protein